MQDRSAVRRIEESCGVCRDSSWFGSIDHGTVATASMVACISAMKLGCQ